jgi:hypothetical protein
MVVPKLSYFYRVDGGNQAMKNVYRLLMAFTEAGA